MQKPETKFRKKVRADLSALVKAGAALFFEAIQQRAIKGSPDYILCANAHFIGLELKDREGELATLQEQKLKRIAQAGGIAIVTDQNNWPDVLDYIKSLLEEK